MNDEVCRRQAFLTGLAADFAALRADPKAWAEELEERAVWEGTLMDDLNEHEPDLGVDPGLHAGGQ